MAGSSTTLINSPRILHRTALTRSRLKASSPWRATRTYVSAAAGSVSAALAILPWAGRLSLRTLDLARPCRPAKASSRSIAWIRSLPPSGQFSPTMTSIAGPHARLRMTTSVPRPCSTKCSGTWDINFMLQTKYLIVNADDFGQSNGINLGIMEAFENGIVTSASLMVRWPSAEAAADYARKHPKLSIGLHVDLGEWAYRQGKWMSLYEVVSRDNSAAVTEEVHRQLATFRNLMGREPSHIDSHQHVHRTDPLRSVLM